MLGDCAVCANLPAVDLGRAKRFYREKVGLKVSRETDYDLMFEAGKGTMLYIYKRNPTRADHTVASFEVKNLEDEVKQLRKKGVVFEEYDMPEIKTVNGIATMGSEKAAWFKDTEGNILCIHQK